MKHHGSRVPMPPKGKAKSKAKGAKGKGKGKYQKGKKLGRAPTPQQVVEEAPTVLRSANVRAGSLAPIADLLRGYGG